MTLTRPKYSSIIDTDFKINCKAATTGANITLSGGAPNALDGVNLQVNDRVLVKDQSTASQNGVYTVTTVGTGSNGTWTRARDFNSSETVTSGIVVPVSQGALAGSRLYLLTTPDPITLGTTGLTFSSLNASISSGNSNVAVAINGNVSVSAAGNANVLTVTGTGANITGNVSVGGNITYTGNLFQGSTLRYAHAWTTNSSAPAGPTLGDWWYNTNAGTLNVRANNGITDLWVDVLNTPLNTVIATGNITLSASNDTVISTATSDITVTLPTAAILKSYYFANNSDYQMTIQTTGGQLINDNTSLILQFRNSSLRLISNGTKFLIF